MNLSSFVAELKRRNVIRVAGLYLVGAWLLTQVAGTLLPTFDAPSGALRGLVITLAIGFIPAVIFSWVFELTPEGLKRDEDVAPEQSATPQSGRRMDRMIIVVLVLALGYFAFDKFVLAPRREAALVADALPNESKPVINAKSIAVLPFENLSDEKQNAYFADGVQDEILTDLAKIADLKVISRTSVMQYKKRDRAQPAQDRGGARRRPSGRRQCATRRREGARERAVDRRAHRCASLGANLRSRLADVFAIQSEIAKAIADQLQAKLSPTRRKPSTNRPRPIWRLSTFTAGRSHFASRQVSARRASQTCGRRLNFWMKR